MERRQVFTLIGAIMLLSVSGIALANTTASGPSDAALSEEDARQIAENETDGTAQAVEFENEEDEGPVYEVTVDTDQGVKEVDVDGDSGEVLEIESEADENENEADENENEADENENEAED